MSYQIGEKFENNFCHSVQGKGLEGKREEKLEWQIPKHFALHANAIIILFQNISQLRFICSKSKIKKLEEIVKSVQSPH